MPSEKPEEPTVLDIAYQALDEELQRIEYLLTPGPNHPLGKFGGTASRRFRAFQLRAADFRVKLGDALKAEEANLEEIWAKLAAFRSRIMPVYSSEFLAVIGGLYLIEHGLDNVRNAYWEEDDPDAGGVGALREDGSQTRALPALESFSELARSLVNDDLAMRTTADFKGVLIVGEERAGYPPAKIIRLRFPACDIWNLPFTASEYGYLLVAPEEPLTRSAAYPSERQEPIAALRQELLAEVDPREHGEKPPPLGQRLSFLPEIVGPEGLWKQYHVDERLDPQELERLRRRQDIIFCRLFADAFATVYAGPAFVHALLNLRFTPDETLETFVDNHPPFTARFLFALETLRWMSEQHKTLTQNRGTFERAPFDAEVNRTAGIQARWRKTLQTAGRQDSYAEFRTRHAALLERIHAIFKAQWNNYADWTFESWRTVSYLKEGIAQTPLVLAEKDHHGKPWQMWAILNAAWAARVENAVAVARTIEKNALTLMDKNTFAQWYRPEIAREQMSAARGGMEARPTTAIASPGLPNEDLAAVIIALADESQLLERFNRMRNQGIIRRDIEIVSALAGNAPALQAYLRLLAQ